MVPPHEGVNAEFEPPAVRLKAEGVRATPDTETVAALTVTAQVATFPPSAVETVMVAVPVPIPVTSPLELTVATALLLVAQLAF